jgi:predicted phage terminase large subunit-like protein
LWLEREGPAEIATIKKQMGSWVYAAQYQQDPVPQGAGIFQREWFGNTFVTDPNGMPVGKTIVFCVQSWDTAAKKKDSNDYWACTTWGKFRDDDRLYMLHYFKKRMEYVEGRRSIQELKNRWKPNAILIEDSNSGTAMISDLRTTGIPLIPISPAGSDKESNARAVSPMFEAGKILLPSNAPWAAEYIESMIRFPKGTHDDDVDSTSQALNYLRTRKHGVSEYIAREMEEIAERKLCAYTECARGENGKRTKLDLATTIYYGGPSRYCSMACMQGKATETIPIPIFTGGPPRDTEPALPPAVQRNDFLAPGRTRKF